MVAMSATGRFLSPAPPRPSQGDWRTRADALRRQLDWLIVECLREAWSRGDNYYVAFFLVMHAAKLSQHERLLLTEYLFGSTQGSVRFCRLPWAA